MREKHLMQFITHVFPYLVDVICYFKDLVGWLCCVECIFSFDCNKPITTVSITSPKKENITRSQQELEENQANC